MEFSYPERGERIVALMSALGVSTSSVELEITEQCVMQNMDTAVEMLEKLSVQESINDTPLHSKCSISPENIITTPSNYISCLVHERSCICIMGDLLLGTNATLWS